MTASTRDALRRHARLPCDIAETLSLLALAASAIIVLLLH